MKITTTIFLEKGLHKDKSNTKYSLMNVSMLCYIDISEGIDVDSTRL